MVNVLARSVRQGRVLDHFHSWYVQRRILVLAGHLAVAMSERGSALDIGCGDGKLALALMRMRPDLKVEGVEQSPQAGAPIAITAYDGLQLPFADKSFDYVTLVDVLHHSDDPAALLREASRVARRGVVIKDHLREGVLARETLGVLDWLDSFGAASRRPATFLSREEWRDVFARGRVRSVQTVDSLGLYRAPFGWLFDRKLHFVSLLEPINLLPVSGPLIRAGA